MSRPQWRRPPAPIDRPAPLAHRAHGPEVVAAAQYFAQAQVDAQLLIGIPEWDSYLRMAQARQEADLEIEGAMLEQIEGDHWIAPERLVEIRHHLALARARIAARQDLMTLPRQVLDAAKTTG